MNKLRRMPTDYEKKAIRFNKRIEIIQVICHIIGVIGILGFLCWAYGLATIDYGTDEVSVTAAIMETLKGLSALGLSFLLLEM